MNRNNIKHLSLKFQARKREANQLAQEIQQPYSNLSLFQARKRMANQLAGDTILRAAAGRDRFKPASGRPTI